MSSRFARWLLLATICTAPIATAVGQTTFSANAEEMSTSHPLMANTLWGWSAEARVPFDGAAASLLLSFQKLHGGGNRTGVPCAGLIMPGSCPVQAIHDDARYSAFSIGVAVSLIRRSSFELEWTVSGTYAKPRVVSLGATGEGLSAEKDMLGATLGIDGGWRPIRRLPVSINAGVAIGGLHPASTDMVVDGYTPFEGDFRTTTFRLGVSIEADRNGDCRALGRS